MAELRLDRLTRRYGDVVAVDDLTLDVRDREFMTLLGPSGCGKTTALRVIAGYIAPTAGSVLVDGHPIDHLPPERRNVGMVFQSYALFPHLSVWRNVAFGLERRRVTGDELSRRVQEALALVHLEPLAARIPRELSGGQQQRVALARALVIKPRLLLLDEPLSNLDARLRAELRIEMRRLQRELGITTVLVTHDQEEALTVSDRVAVLRGGRLQQVASPTELYEQPANRFVADFIGRMNLMSVDRESTEGGIGVYRLAGAARITAPAGPMTGSPAGVLALRPEAIHLGAAPGPAGHNQLEGTLAYRAFLGEIVELGIALPDGTQVVVRGPHGDAPEAPGASVRFWWRADEAAVFPDGD